MSDFGCRISDFGFRISDFGECITAFGIWMGDGNQLPPAGETACPTYFAKRLFQQGGAGGFACRSNGLNQRSASKMNKIPKNVRRPAKRLPRPALSKMAIMPTPGTGENPPAALSPPPS